MEEHLGKKEKTHTLGPSEKVFHFGHMAFLELPSLS